jgi:hypothetical protein
MVTPCSMRTLSSQANAAYESEGSQLAHEGRPGSSARQCQTRHDVVPDLYLTCKDHDNILSWWRLGSKLPRCSL